MSKQTLLILGVAFPALVAMLAFVARGLNSYALFPLLALSMVVTLVFVFATLIQASRKDTPNRGKTRLLALWLTVFILLQAVLMTSSATAM